MRITIAVLFTDWLLVKKSDAALRKNENKGSLHIFCEATVAS